MYCKYDYPIPTCKCSLYCKAELFIPLTPHLKNAVHMAQDNKIYIMQVYQD